MDKTSLGALLVIGLMASAAACGSGSGAASRDAGTGDAAVESGGGAGVAGSRGTGGGDAATDARTDSNGGAAGGGGTADGGPGGEGGANSDGGGSAGTDGGGGSAGTDGGPPSPVDPTTIAVVGGTASEAGTAGRHLLVAGTDFSTTTEVASVDLQAADVTARITVPDGDAVPAASGGRGFILERTRDRVDLLTAAGSLDKSIDVTALGDSSPPSSLAHAAFVTLYGANRIAVVDLDAARVAYSIDLTSYLDPADSDGLVDVDNAIYDPAARRVYVTLARIDRNTITSPNYQLACPNEGGLLLAFDPATFAPIDLNGAAPGDGLALSLVDPISVALDSANHRLLVMGAGCFAAADGGAHRVSQGIEAVDLSTDASSVLYQPGTPDFLNRLILIGSGQALVDRFDASYLEHWNRWQLGASTLGSELSGVPDGVSYDGAGALLGVTFPAPDAGQNPSVVSYSISTGNQTPLVSSPWNGSFSSVAGSALVE